MFYHQATNKYIQENTQFELEGITYPSMWLNQSTPEQKLAIGLEEVVITNSPYNPKYYWAGETLEGATLTYIGIPKDLDEIKQTESRSIKNIVYSILQPTDYIEIRNIRDPLYKPEWIQWRESILSYYNTIINQINNSTSIEEIEQIEIEWPPSPDSSI